MNDPKTGPSWRDRFDEAGDPRDSHDPWPAFFLCAALIGFYVLMEFVK